MARGTKAERTGSSSDSQAGATRTLFYYYAKLRLDEAQTESSGFGSAKLSYGGQDIIELDSPAHLRQYSDASFLGRSYLWFYEPRNWYACFHVVGWTSLLA